MAEENLSGLVANITADGVVDAGEVAMLRESLYADGTIDRAEVDALFEINDAVSGNDNDASWVALFVEAISGHIMEDGVIDAEETAYLKSKIEGDGAVDSTELALLEHLKSHAGDNFPSELAALMS